MFTVHHRDKKSVVEIVQNLGKTSMRPMSNLRSQAISVHKIG